MRRRGAAIATVTGQCRHHNRNSGPNTDPNVNRLGLWVHHHPPGLVSLELSADGHLAVRVGMGKGPPWRVSARVRGME